MDIAIGIYKWIYVFKTVKNDIDNISTVKNDVYGQFVQ